MYIKTGLYDVIWVTWYTVKKVCKVTHIINVTITILIIEMYKSMYFYKY